eukprot:5953978-Lingulodinium_polyedra.AAC.1
MESERPRGSIWGQIGVIWRPQVKRPTKPKECRFIAIIYILSKFYKATWEYLKAFGVNTESFETR